MGSEVYAHVDCVDHVDCGDSDDYDRYDYFDHFDYSDDRGLCVYALFDHGLFDHGLFVPSDFSQDVDDHGVGHDGGHDRDALNVSVF